MFLHEVETTWNLSYGISMFVVSHASKSHQIPVLCIEISLQ